MAAALAAGSGVFQLSMVSSEGAGADPELAVALLDMGRGFGMAFLPLGVLLGAIALEGVRGTIVARWLGWSAAVLAVGLFVGYVASEVVGFPLVFFVIMLTWLWFVPASISMIRRAGRPAGDQRQRRIGWRDPGGPTMKYGSGQAAPAGRASRR